MATNKDRSLFLQILESEGGQNVGRIFFATLFNSKLDLEMAIEEATKTAKENGTLAAFQIALLVDGLRIIAELIRATKGSLK